MSDNALQDKIDMLADCSEYLQRIYDDFDNINELIRKKENIGSIPNISEGVFSVLKIIEHTADIHEIRPDFDEIKELIADVLDGMENGDYNLIADIFEYEIKPLYEQWIKSISEALKQYD